MELAVVSIGPEAVRAVDGPLSRLSFRLGPREWTSVHTDHRLTAPAEHLAALVNAKIVAAQSIDVGRLITDFRGTKIIAVCSPAVTRELAATVMDVSASGLALPQDFSLTIIRASRRGTRTLHCLNDTLHLAGERPPAVNRTTVGDERCASNVEGVPFI